MVWQHVYYHLSLSDSDRLMLLVNMLPMVILFSSGSLLASDMHPRQRKSNAKHPLQSFPARLLLRSCSGIGPHSKTCVYIWVWPDTWRTRISCRSWAGGQPPQGLEDTHTRLEDTCRTQTPGKKWAGGQPPQAGGHPHTQLEDTWRTRISSRKWAGG